MQAFQIKLPQFEGPFDLLLFFIERDELNIYDIPISKITDEFLDYIRHMELLNIELASEFILVAASLMKIKSRMLIPRKELNDQGEEIDPRDELVQKLLEYRKFKSASLELEKMAEERSRHFKRGSALMDLKKISEAYSSEAELQSLTLYKMLVAFHKVLDRFEHEQNKPRHTVYQPKYTIEDSKTSILSKMKGSEKASFISVFQECESRMHSIFMFLALLELIQQNNLKIYIGEGLNNFWISAGAEYGTSV